MDGKRSLHFLAPAYCNLMQAYCNWAGGSVQYRGKLSEDIPEGDGHESGFFDYRDPAGDFCGQERVSGGESRIQKPAEKQ